MSARHLVCELLDQLDHDDPSAIRSRADIRRINGLMGNFRWLRRTLERSGALGANLRIVEIGAGRGDLGLELRRRHPRVNYTGIDLVPPPRGFPLPWRQGDALAQLADCKGDVLVANLFLHHLSDTRLRELGGLLSSYQAVICNEPLRSSRSQALALAVRGLGINHVTRFDIHASIEAGFRDRELPRMLGMAERPWRVDVSHTFLGAYRMIALRP